MFYKTSYLLTFYIKIFVLYIFIMTKIKIPLFHINTIKYLYNDEDLNTIQER